MSASPVQKYAPVSARRIGLAAVAAFIACAACCTLPLLAAAGFGSGLVAALSSVFRPGPELIVGGGVFVVALGVMAVWRRVNGHESSGCGPACAVDGSCCDHGMEQKIVP